MAPLRQLRRAIQIFWAFARRNRFWGLYRDLHQHLTNQDCACVADQRLAGRAARLREALEELGPTFVKLGQVLSRRPDLVPRSYLKELERLQDRAAPVPFAAVRAQPVARCICGEAVRHQRHDPQCLHCIPFDQVFDAFEETPVAAASLAQVHRATFRGHAVAVKILRPGVLDRINTDLAIVRRFRRLLLRGLGLAGSLDPREFFEEFRRRLQAEVDLKREALNIERFRANRDPGGPTRRRWPRVYALAAPLLGSAAARGDAEAAARVHMWGIGLWMLTIWGLASAVLVLGICWLAIYGRRRQRARTRHLIAGQGPSEETAFRERVP